MFRTGGVGVGDYGVTVNVAAVWGWALGASIALGGFAAVIALIGWLHAWATKHATPRDSFVDDEDEIDHRFY